MTKVALVTVPFIVVETHFRSAQITMNSLHSAHPLERIAIVNRSRPDGPEQSWLANAFDYVEFNDRNSVARAWNRGITVALEHGARYVLVINLDLILHSQCIDQLVACAEQNPKPLIWSASPSTVDPELLEQSELSGILHPTCNTSCFMVDARLFSLIGQFDERFEPAYYEDADMLYRLRLAGHETCCTGSALFFHRERATVKALASSGAEVELLALQSGVDISKQRYIEKWGGEPGHERFSTPQS